MKDITTLTTLTSETIINYINDRITYYSNQETDLRSALEKINPLSFKFDETKVAYECTVERRLALQDLLENLKGLIPEGQG